MGDLPKRRPNRLKGYDYSQAGYYFVTVCTKGRKELFWEQERAGLGPARSPVALSEVMRQFKSFSARRVNTARGTSGAPVWQRGYHDHIIRNDADYLRIWDYIDTNPAKWREDRFYSGARMVRPVTPPPV